METIVEDSTKITRRVAKLLASFAGVKELKTVRTVVGL